MHDSTKLKLADIRKTLPFKISNELTDFSIADLVANKYGDKIDYDVFLPTKGMNLQRDFCWTPLQKEELIKSVLKGITLAPLSIIKYRKDTGGAVPCTYKIIDGKQRLSTLVEFVKGEFCVSFGNDDTIFFKNLDIAAQNAIALFTPSLRYAYEYDYDMISDDDKIAWFNLINFSGTAQDAMHMQKLLNAQNISIAI